LAGSGIASGAGEVVTFCGGCCGGALEPIGEFFSNIGCGCCEPIGAFFMCIFEWIGGACAGGICDWVGGCLGGGFCDFFGSLFACLPQIGEFLCGIFACIPEICGGLCELLQGCDLGAIFASLCGAFECLISLIPR